MHTPSTKRILIVAHKSVATPSLVHEVRRRTEAGPCRLALLMPDASDPAVAAWTLRRARRMLSEAVGTPVDGIVSEGDDPYAGIAAALREEEYDEEEERDADLERTLALGDEIQAGLDRVMTVVARELQRDAIPRALGRPLPVLLHGPVYDATFATAAREANQPGTVDAFAAWAERQDPVE